MTHPEREELIAALEPFAKAEYDLSESALDKGDIWETAAACGITHGDIRRAKKTYDALRLASSTPAVEGEQKRLTAESKHQTEQSHADVSVREQAARAVWAKRPDCNGKPWPIETAEQRRAYPHNPIAAVDLCFIYADAVLALVAQGIEQGSSKPEVAGSIPAERANLFSASHLTTFDEGDNA